MSLRDTVLSERLIDYLLLVGPGRGMIFEKSLSSTRRPSPGSSLGSSWQPVSRPQPTILRKFPSEDHPDFELVPDVAYFCQPDGCCVECSSPKTHTFMLTDTESNLRTYGVCLSLSHLFDPLMELQAENDLCSIGEANALCIQEWGVLSVCVLSRHPFFTFLERCLMTLAHFIEHYCGEQLTWNGLIRSQFSPGQTLDARLPGNAGSWFTVVREVERWIGQLLALKAPQPGESALEVELEVDPAVVVCYPSHSRLPLLDISLHSVLRRVGVCNLIDIYKLVLSEEKVILHSSDPAIVSECVLAVVSLLYPLQYLFPVIPLLPTSMPTAENLLMVPTPFFIGVSSTFLTKLQDIHVSEAWMINLDTGKFQSPAQTDQQSLLEFPYCILQLQADIRKALDKLDKATQPSLHTFKESLDDSYCSTHSTVEEQLCCQGDDADVTIRIAFIDFLFSPEILGTIDRHLCIFRLFPRPVVTLRSSSFLNAYRKLSPTTDIQFITDLMHSQGIEYFYEWSLNPTNSAFEEIRRGMHDIQRLSDKQRYFIHKSGLKIHQVCLYEINDDSILYQEMLTHKASQASYHLVVPSDLTTGDEDDNSDWECLPGEYAYGTSSDFSHSASSLYSSDRGTSLTPPLSGRVVLSHRGRSNFPESNIPVVGSFDVDSDTDAAGDVQPRSRHPYPNAHLSRSTRAGEHLFDISVASTNMDTSSLTESANVAYDRPRPTLQVSTLGPRGLSISCEVLPNSNHKAEPRSPEEDVERPRYFTPDGASDETSELGRSRRFSFPDQLLPSNPPVVLTSPPANFFTPVENVGGRYYISDDDTILVTRRRLGQGDQEIRRSWLNLATPSAEVVEFSTSPSNLRRANSLRLKWEGSPQVSRTVPLSAVTHSQALESQLHDVVMKILDGQGLPWPKPPGLKRLATFEKTRVVVLRLLETKLGLRRSSELATSVDTEILLVGVAKSVYRGLLDLLKYFLQCIEEELHKEPEASVFSAFLILRLAFSVFLQPKGRPHSAKVTKSEIEQSRQNSSLPFPTSLTSFDSTSLASGDTISISGSPSGSAVTVFSLPEPVRTTCHILIPEPHHVTRRDVPLGGHAHSDTSLAQRNGKPKEHHPYIAAEKAVPVREGQEEEEGELGRERGGEVTVPTATPGLRAPLTPDVGQGEGGGGGGEESGRGGGSGGESRSGQEAAAKAGAKVARKSSATESCTSLAFPSSPSAAHAWSSPQQDRETERGGEGNGVSATYSPSTSHLPSQTSDSESPLRSPANKQRTQAQDSEQQFSSPGGSRGPGLLRRLQRETEVPSHRSFLYRDLMKALGGSGRNFMLRQQFWNVLFMSVIHLDRNCMGWNERTSELYERYNSLSEAHRQAFASEEDTVLSLILHNLMVYMLMVGLTTGETTSLIHRLMAKTRLAISEERQLQLTLKHVEHCPPAELDLSELGLMTLYSETHLTIFYIVHYGINMIAPVYKLQITSEALILRRFPDEKISIRLWNESVTSLSYNERRATVSIKYRDTNGEYNHHFHTKQFMKVFESLQILVFGGHIS